MALSRHQKEKQARDTGLAVILILLIIALLTGKYTHCIGFAIASLVVTMIWPTFFLPLSYVWLGFSKFFGGFVSRILLSLVFFLIAVPVGVLRNITGADSMKRKEWKKSHTSVFRERQHKYGSEDLERPY